MENKLRVVLFVSRNKDNKHLNNYTQRKKSFLTKKSVEELEESFMDFVNKGLNGEMSRMYLSVNSRDEKSVKRELMHELFDNNVDLVKMESKLASLASKSRCAAEKKWMFDFDSEDKNLLNNFVSELEVLTELKPAVYKIPNGYAVVVERGFDPRELLSKYPFVELKRDDMLCVKWVKKQECKPYRDDKIEIVKNIITNQETLKKERSNLLEKINLIKDDPSLNAKVGWEIRLIQREIKNDELKIPILNELDILKFLLEKEELMLNNYKNYNNYLDEIIVKSLEKK